MIGSYSEKPRIVCHAPGERCLGCAHYHGKAPVCTFAKPCRTGRARSLGGDRAARTNLVVAVGEIFQPVLVELGRIAARRNVSRSDLVRDVLTRYVKEEERAARARKREDVDFDRKSELAQGERDRKRKQQHEEEAK